MCVCSVCVCIVCVCVSMCVSVYLCVLCVCAYVCLSMKCVCVVCVSMWLCICVVCIAWQWRSEVNIRFFFSLFYSLLHFKTGSPTDSRAHPWLVWLAIKLQDPQVSTSPGLGLQAYALHMNAGDETQGLTFAQQSSYHPSHLPSPPPNSYHHSSSLLFSLKKL